MRIIFGMAWYQIQAVWAKICPPRELVLEIEEIKKDEHGRLDVAVVVIRDKKSNKITSRTNVILLSKEFIDKVQQAQQA